MHRARMACAHLRGFGWEPLVLAVDSAEQDGVKDGLLTASLPKDLRVWRAAAIPRRLTRWAGVRNVGLRSVFHIAALGSRIIESESPDVVFFSTTMFALFALGPYWQWRHRVPYVLDFQDPWWVEPSREEAKSWKLKRRGSNALARLLEPVSVKGAAHIVAVSEHYPAMLQRRYTRVLPPGCSVIPFCADPGELEFLRSRAGASASGDERGRGPRWLYAGAVSKDMVFAVRAFFCALAQARVAAPERLAGLSVRFVGTSYAPGQEAVGKVAAVADEYGLGDLVSEQPERLGYFDALRSIIDADALILPGSTDESYTPSKLLTYIMARKPLLAILSESSNASSLMRQLCGGTLVTFSPGEEVAAVAARILERWQEEGFARVPDVDWQEFERHCAPAMTRRLCTIFAEAAASRQPLPDA